jgi:hypothetical protein
LISVAGVLVGLTFVSVFVSTFVLTSVSTFSELVLTGGVASTYEVVFLNSGSEDLTFQPSPLINLNNLASSLSSSGKYP